MWERDCIFISVCTGIKVVVLLGSSVYSVGIESNGSKKKADRSEAGVFLRAWFCPGIGNIGSGLFGCIIDKKRLRTCILGRAFS